MKRPRYRSTVLRAKAIRELTMRYYEPGRKDRSYMWVWRRYIRPQFGICYRTYMTYLDIPTGDDEPRRDGMEPGQLSLFGQEGGRP